MSREEPRPGGGPVGRTLRSLLIASDYPWPENTGARIRMVTALKGLVRCGPTELFSILPPSQTPFDPPDESLGLARVGRTEYDDRTSSIKQVSASMVRPSMPMSIPWLERTSVLAALGAFVSGRYDLIWCYGIKAWVLAGEPRAAPTVVDINDLEDEKILARLSIPRPPRPGVLGRLRDAGASAYSEEEVRRWRRIHRRAQARSSKIVLCSTLDARRAADQGVSNVSIIPNGYNTVPDPVGRIEVGEPPTVLFQGFLRYPPNAQAARDLIGEIGPRLRRLRPDARIRLVGLSTPELSALDDPPRVTVVGRVADMEAELARADLVVVPLRIGSGTRVKILEAFAQRIPVVSTTLGAEGLGAEDGEHLLIGDDPDSFAAAVARLLSETELRKRITEQAHQLFLDHFQRDRIAGEVAAVARAVAGP